MVRAGMSLRMETTLRRFFRNSPKGNNPPPTIEFDTKQPRYTTGLFCACDLWAEVGENRRCGSSHIEPAYEGSIVRSFDINKLCTGDIWTSDHNHKSPSLYQ